MIYYVAINDHNYYSEADRTKLKPILLAKSAFDAVPAVSLTAANVSARPPAIIYLGIFFLITVFSLIVFPYCE